MRGQWAGQYSNKSGDIIINIDALPTCYQGVAYLHPYGTATPRSVVRFRSKDKSPTISTTTKDFHPLHPDTGRLVK